MRRLTNIEDAEAELEFAKKAARAFASDSSLVSFSEAPVGANALMALRWGIMDRAILVFKISDDVPTVYQDCITSQQ